MRCLRSPQKSLALRWQGSEFEALRSDVGAGATDVPGAQGAFIDALPDAAKFGNCAVQSIVCPEIDVSPAAGGVANWNSGENTTAPLFAATICVLSPAAHGASPVTLLARTDIDDWALSPLTADQRNDILEILEDRYGSRSTIFASQLDAKRYHEYLADPTVADAACDRLLHNAPPGRAIRTLPTKGECSVRTTLISVASLRSP